MNWIKVSERVPDNRRSVLAWGRAGIGIGGYQSSREQFLGATKYNKSSNGSGQFDVEQPARFSFSRVTHWAEIEGPSE